MIDADGSGEIALTGEESSNWGPDWSPDGGSIAFVSDRNDFPQVYVMSADGTGQRRLTGVPKAFTSTGVRCTIVGTSGNDTVSGTTANDVMCLLGGKDRVVGGAGNDVIDAGAGDDRLTGGAGVDLLLGSAGRDVLFAVDGLRDHVDGGAGHDRAQIDPTDWISRVEATS